MSSALTNTSSKSILIVFPNPVTLTLVQFAFVSFWCIFFAYLAYLFPFLRRAIPALRHGIRYPSRDVIRTTLPLALFQVGGHLLSSTAIGKIPVSLVHTIKGLSPLFTVLAYRFVLKISHSTATYLSLIPLTLGVILACSVEFSGNLFGILCAFGGAIIFVTQNIFSKKLFNEAAQAEAEGITSAQARKLDKLNLLCYCSGLAFFLTIPIWFWTDAPQSLLRRKASDNSTSSESILYLPFEFIFNGIFHFGQNILAFILLSLVSPVTYSVASLIKRVFVIVVAIIWFGNQTTPLQAFGIALTFLGLYLYDRNNDTSKAERRAKLEALRAGAPLLPLTSLGPLPTLPVHPHHTSSFLGGTALTETPASASSGYAFGTTSNFATTVNGDEKKLDATGPGRPSPGKGATAVGSAWLPHGHGPSIGQEETWRPRENGVVG